MSETTRNAERHMANDKALTTTSSQAVAQYGELSVQAIVDRKRKIVQVMEAVMREGEHYGKIPGCGDKPTLFKSGAEVLAMTFGLAPTFKIDRIDLPNGHREYQVVCTLTHIATGATVGEGVGCGTTMESKHRWRGGGRVCPECGKSAIIKGKADYGGGWLCFAKKGGCGAKWKDGDQAIDGQQVDRIENPDPADQYNTALKMAKKRAQVDCTLTATGASDLLSQDLEDLPPGSGDYSDAEFVDRPSDSAQRGRPSRESVADDQVAGLLAEIDSARSMEDLEAMIPRLKNVKGPGYQECRARYGARKQALAGGR